MRNGRASASSFCVNTGPCVCPASGLGERHPSHRRSVYNRLPPPAPPSVGSWVGWPLARSLPCALIHLFICSLIHSLYYSLAHSFMVHPHCHSPALLHSFKPLPAFILSLTHSFNTYLTPRSHPTAPILTLSLTHS